MLEERALNRIIEHMNDDHADALLLYVQAFAGHTEATSARLVTFDERGMGICFSTSDGAESECRIDFDVPLAHAGEARRVLVEMVDEARAARCNSDPPDLSMREARKTPEHSA